jgi:hypothetical protein
VTRRAGISRRGGKDKIDVPPRVPISGRRPATAWEGFREVLAGGPIRNLTVRRVRITHKGIDVVQRHIARFGPDRANEIMVDRLRGLLWGELHPTDWDRYFYSHELREFARYRRLGWREGVPPGDAATDLWRQAHCAILEEYALPLHCQDVLYRPDAQPYLGS